MDCARLYVQADRNYRKKPRFDGHFLLQKFILEINLAKELEVTAKLSDVKGETFT
jgi:hypothetical protein